ncbi:MAG: LPS export ABC transporter periplasmic protein LptC [Bacteroidota bacterium]
MRHLLTYSIVVMTFFSCGNTDKEIQEIQPYEGPIREARDMTLFHSESAQVKVKLVTARLLEYESGDKEFPEGIYIEFFDENGKMTSTLEANEAYYFKEEDHWRGRGDVEVKSIENSQQLNTEELFWKPKEEKIFTEKFVTIKLPEQILNGYGLDAKQDFSFYHIKDPTGVIYLNE